jgi:hypothetical protein
VRWGGCGSPVWVALAVMDRHRCCGDEVAVGLGRDVMDEAIDRCINHTASSEPRDPVRAFGAAQPVQACACLLATVFLLASRQAGPPSLLVDTASHDS